MNKEGTFMWAVEQMKKGFVLNHGSWFYKWDNGIVCFNDIICTDVHYNQRMMDHEINDTDWKIINEKEKSWQEQFPSLKLKIQQSPRLVSVYSTFTMENLLKDIQKHCIDKKVLKEEMKRISEAIKNGARCDFQLELMGKFQLFGDK